MNYWKGAAIILAALLFFVLLFRDGINETCWYPTDRCVNMDRDLEFHPERPMW